MARVLQIKRKATTGAGPTLAAGEFAFNTNDDYLYLGDGASNNLLFSDVSAGKAVAAATADNATQLNSQNASYYLDCANFTGTLDNARLASTVVLESDVDDTPVNGATTDPISSNWAYDHVADADPHTGYMLESNIGTSNGNYIVLGASGLPAVAASLITDVTNLVSNVVIPSGATGTTQSAGDNSTAIATTAYVDAAAAALGTSAEWQASVLDFFDPTSGLPGSPSTGDRYIASATANGWTTNYIYEYNGSTWDETIPTTGTYTSADDETDRLYYFGGSSWTAKYYEATTASTGLTKSGLDIQIASSAAGDGLGFSSGVLSVNVDGSTIETNSDTLRVKADGINDTHIDWGTGANQVSAVDIPIADSGAYTDETEVEGALQEIYATIDGLSNGYAFTIIDADSGTDATADQVGDTLVLTGGNGVTTVGSDPDTITINLVADETTGATVCGLEINANGAGIEIDNDSVIHSSNVLAVGDIDCGAWA